jgi:hypothetical protein
VTSLIEKMNLEVLEVRAHRQSKGQRKTEGIERSKELCRVFLKYSDE